jgi:peroxiredoxin
VSRDIDRTEEIPLLSYAQPSARLLADFLSGLDTPTRQIVETSLERLLSSDIAAQAKRSGDRAPDFALPSARGGEIRLSGLLESGPVVLSFFRGGWCPFCTLEFRALSVILPQLEARGATLLGVSPELPEHGLATLEHNHLDFDLLSDSGNAVTRDYGLLMSVPEEMRSLYLEWGFDVPEHTGDDSWELPVPATYVIDREGTIRSASVDKDYTRRMEPLAILEAVRELKS